ncbi:hypothetical protein B0H13DRAFT_1909511 [Mycena leptocephala]|nr:hypothetical protein B0H13DRAFT_1909511 [Mycena leptocephala]
MAGSASAYEGKWRRAGVTECARSEVGRNLTSGTKQSRSLPKGERISGYRVVRRSGDREQGHKRSERTGSVRVEADERTVGRTTFALEFLSCKPRGAGEMPTLPRQCINADINIARESREVLTRRSNEDILKRSEVVERGPNPSHLAQSNPLIFGITEWGSTFSQKPDDDSELLATLARNRNNWAKNIPIPKGDDTRSRFIFSTSFVTLHDDVLRSKSHRRELSVTFTRPTWHGRRYALRKVWVFGEEAIESESDDTEEDPEEDESEHEEGNVNEGETKGDEGEGSETEGEELEVVDDIDSESQGEMSERSSVVGVYKHCRIEKNVILFVCVVLDNERAMSRVGIGIGAETGGRVNGSAGGRSRRGTGVEGLEGVAMAMGAVFVWVANVEGRRLIEAHEPARD